MAKMKNSLQQQPSLLREDSLAVQNPSTSGHLPLNHLLSHPLPLMTAVLSFAEHAVVVSPSGQAE